MRRLIVVVASLVAAGAAIAAPNELATSNLNTPAGKMTRLAAKTVYRASSFPLGLELTAPDGTWAGSQWTTSSKGKKTFAWVATGHGGTTATSPPRGLVMIVTAIGPTPSVSATIARIRSGGGGVTFETSSPAKVAGYTGTQFDGSVFGIFGHTFVPFTPKTHGAAPSDAWHIDKGEAFRFTVISVRGKTVVVFEESFGLPAKQFPSFLPGASHLLASLRFTAPRATASSGAIQKVADLLRSTVTVAPLAVGTTYGASLITPTPNLTPVAGGWFGAQFVSHQGGKVRYETAVLFWHGQRHEVDIISGPAMTMSPADTLARPLSRHFNFAPYDPPTPVKRWTVAGRQALYFDATAPPPGEWTVVGANPPELRIDHDNSFRMAALGVRGKTVVIIIRAPAAEFKRFLPISVRLVASLRFRSG